MSVEKELADLRDDVRNLIDPNKLLEREAALEKRLGIVDILKRLGDLDTIAKQALKVAGTANAKYLETREQLADLAEKVTDCKKMIANNTVWVSQAKGYSRHVVGMKEQIQDLTEKVEALEKRNDEMDEYNIEVDRFNDEIDHALGSSEVILTRYGPGPEEKQGSWVCTECGKVFDYGMMRCFFGTHGIGGDNQCPIVYEGETCRGNIVPQPSPDTDKPEARTAMEQLGIPRPDYRPIPDKPSPDTEAPESDNVERCFITNNPCGTDTWVVGQPCTCTQCQRWIMAEIDRLQADNADLTAQCASLNDSCDKYEKEIELLKEGNARVHRKIQPKNERINELEADLKAAQETIELAIETVLAQRQRFKEDSAEYNAFTWVLDVLEGRDKGNLKDKE